MYSEKFVVYFASKSILYSIKLYYAYEHTNVCLYLVIDKGSYYKFQMNIKMMIE